MHTNNAEVARCSALASVATILIYLYYQDITLPLAGAVSTLACITVAGLLTQKAQPLAFLTRLMIVAYALPFLTLLGYLFSQDYEWWGTPRARLYISDHHLQARMVTVAIIGMIGLLLGMRLASLVRSRANTQSLLPSTHDQKAATLPLLPFSCLLVFAVLLSWLSAPTKDIFAAGYATVGTEARAADLNFNSAFLISYIVIILLMIDAERERIIVRRRNKYWSVVLVSALIVFFLQIVRGDRESLGLILGLISLYVTGPDRATWVSGKRLAWRRVRRVAVPLCVLLLVFVGLGAARGQLAEPESASLDPIATLRSGLQQSTWTGVLLTNLSLARQDRYGALDTLNGQTYVDYLKSLPPGVITRALGVDRAIEPERSPGGWTSDVGSGGAHVVIVPLKNFGATGVFLVLLGYGFVIARCESSNIPGHLWRRLLFGTVTTCSLLWFWYGDLSLARGLLAAGGLGLFHRFTARSAPGLAGLPLGQPPGLATHSDGLLGAERAFAPGRE